MMVARIGVLIGLVSATDKWNPLKKFNPVEEAFDVPEPSTEENVYHPHSLLEQKEQKGENKLDARLQAYYVNTDKSKARAECMSRQLGEQGIESHRYKAVVMPECPDWELACMSKVVFVEHKDCFKSGADLVHLFQHGSGSQNASMKNRAMAVLANWCSHKRLFHELATNSSNDLQLATFAQQAGKNLLRQVNPFEKNKEKTVKKLGKDEKVHIILEDDAILR